MEKYTQQEVELMMDFYEKLGPKLLTEKINKSADAITDLSSGLYFVEISNAEDKVVKKIIKN